MPLRSIGNVSANPFGIKKSSPGTGGPALLAVPLYGLPLSTAPKSLNVPVEIGPFSVTIKTYAAKVGGSVSAVPFADLSYVNKSGYYHYYPTVNN